MNMKELVDGLNILRPHFYDPDGYHVGAEHDQFYVYATDTPLNEDEIASLRDLGWFQPSCSEDEYQPEEGWSAFT